MYIFTKAGPSKKALVLFYECCFYFNVLTMDNAIGKLRTQLCPLRLVVQIFHACNSENSIKFNRRCSVFFEICDEEISFHF